MNANKKFADITDSAFLPIHITEYCAACMPSFLKTISPVLFRYICHRGSIAGSPGLKSRGFLHFAAHPSDVPLRNNIKNSY